MGWLYRKACSSPYTVEHLLSGPLVRVTIRLVIERSDNRKAKIMGLNAVWRVGLRWENGKFR